MTIQILATVFVGLILLKATRDYLKKKIKISLFIVWLVFWAAVLLAFWWPDLTQRLANFLQVGRGADAVFYISVVVLFYLVFKIFQSR